MWLPERERPPIFRSPISSGGSRRADRDLRSLQKPKREWFRSPDPSPDASGNGAADKRELRPDVSLKRLGDEPGYAKGLRPWIRSDDRRKTMRT